MVEAKQKIAGGSAGSNPPPAPRPVVRRRLVSAPANDNGATPLGRIARAAIFVAIGGALAWALHTVFGWN